jgi:DNA-binding NarL/FixJ family response regulator
MPTKRAQQNTKRILIVDDHPVLRNGLARLIDSKNGFEVCGEAGEANEAMKMIKTVKPDLAIIDLVLPGESGIALTKRIRSQFPNLPVLVLSMHEEQAYATRALRAGAMGYIVKQDAIDNIVAALRGVLEGEHYLSPSIANGALASIGPDAADDGDPTNVLSDRELEILDLIGKGHEVRDIADKLRLSPKTVETHRTHIKEKLKLKNARQVARFAVQWTDQTGP